MSLVSIIVPIFNPPPKLLIGCLTSILKQTYNDFECILVDDGSDASIVALEHRFMKKDRRFRIIEGEHKGVSYARNKGLSAASGDWITFVDSDDVISPYFLKQAISALERYHGQLIVGARETTSEDAIADLFKMQDSIDYQVYKQQNVYIASSFFISGRPLPEMKFGWNIAPGGIAPRVFSKTVANGVRFDESVTFGEDAIYGAIIASKSNVIIVTNAVWYRYTYVKGSSSNNTNIETLYNQSNTLARGLIYASDKHNLKRNDIQVRALASLRNQIKWFSKQSSIKQTVRLDKILFKSDLAELAVNCSIDDQRLTIGDRFCLNCIAKYHPFIYAVGERCLEVVKRHRLAEN